MFLESISWFLSRDDTWVRMAPDLAFSRAYPMLLRDGESFRPNPGLFSFGVDQRPISLDHAGALRLVVLGGSSARGLVKTSGTELVEMSFARRLEESLPLLIGEPVEVVNLAVPGFGSRRVVTMARDALRLKPDLVIAYMGHNEFIEDRIRRNYAEERSWRASVRRLILSTWTGRLYLRRYREPARVDATLRFGGDVEAAAASAEDPALVSEEFRAEEAAVLERTRAQVAEMARLCRSAGVPLLVVPAVPNILDRPMRPGQGALDAWEGALRLKDAGETMAAIVRLREALAGDAWGLRASPKVRETITAAAREDGAEVLDLWDAMHAAQMQETSPFFADYCHPNEAGHRLLGEWMAVPAARLLAGQGRTTTP
jgi:lysophospholipase L1-like esterase